MVNTDFIFQPNIKVLFISPEDSAVASDEFSYTESDATVDNESGQPYNPEERGESDYSSDTSQKSDESLENTFLKELKYLVFWSSLLLLFRYCFTCKEKLNFRRPQSRKLFSGRFINAVHLAHAPTIAKQNYSQRVLYPLSVLAAPSTNRQTLIV